MNRLTRSSDVVSAMRTEFYKEKIETVEKELNGNIREGLDESKIKSARQKYGSNVLKADFTVGIFNPLCS